MHHQDTFTKYGKKGGFMLLRSYYLQKQTRFDLVMQLVTCTRIETILLVGKITAIVYIVTSQHVRHAPAGVASKLRLAAASPQS